MAKTFEARAKLAFASLIRGGAGLVTLANEALVYASEAADFRKAHWLYVNMPRQGCPELFLAWLKAFAPVVHNKKDGKSISFSKDNAKDAKPFNIDGAAKVSYFDYAKPAPEVKTYEASDFVDALERFEKTWLGHCDKGNVEADSIAIIRARVQQLKAFERNGFRVVEAREPAVVHDVQAAKAELALLDVIAPVADVRKAA